EGTRRRSQWNSPVADLFALFVPSWFNSFAPLRSLRLCGSIGLSSVWCRLIRRMPVPERVRYVDELPRNADLVIVGGGIVGAATAFHAARAGLRALVLERRPALSTLTTAAATGGFRLQFDNQEELA